MTNLTHNSFLCVYFYSLHVSSNLLLIIRRINCINTTSGIRHSVSITVSCARRKVPFPDLHTKRSSTQSDIQGVFKKRSNFCYKHLILQHFKHCPLQSSPLYWRYTVPNVSSIVGMLPGMHFL